jgi:hypothetical protein
MIGRAVLALMLAVAAQPALAADFPTGLLQDVIFTEYSPWSRPAELLRRAGSPLLNHRAAQMAKTSGVTLREQDIDLSRERFALYVPEQAPPQGYALLVFVPPWQEAAVPRKWKPVLDRHGMIFVTAANSGNGTSTIERREPLALLAVQNVMKRYRVDPNRVYIGGFSGGSRVAQRTAVGYPDIFHGVLMEAGADTLGDLITLPPAELFHRFQDSTRVVFLTGDHDDSNQLTDIASRKSFRDWCVFDIGTERIPGTWHSLADSGSVSQALDALGKHKEIDKGDLQACRAKIQAEMGVQLRQVDDLIKAGRVDDAKAQLAGIDQRYGGLAADQTIGLSDRIDLYRK